MAANAQIIVEFIANTAKLAAGVKDVEKVGKDAEGATKGLDWKSMAKWGAVAGGLTAATGYIAGAVSATSDLAKATMAVQRATGLAVEPASAWVQLLSERGIDVDTFGKSVTTLAKSMERWRDAGADAPSLLKDLGVSFSDVQKGDTAAVIESVADALAKIDNPAQRAVTMQKLFGRGGADLLPILGKGSDALDDQLGKFKEYGATLNTDTIKAVQETTAAQREMDAAQAGVATTIGAALLPAQASLYGAMADVLKVAAPLLQNTTLMQGAVALAAVAWVAYKVATIASAAAEGAHIAVLAAHKVATLASAAAQWVMNTAIIAGYAPLLLIVAAIAAVIAIGILLYKNWDKVSAGFSRGMELIKSAAKSAFEWIKQNWPLLAAILTGPLGIAVLAIVKNWDKISDGARDAVSAVKRAINDLVSWLKGMVNDVGSAAGKIADAITGPINVVLRAWNGLALHVPSFTLPKVKIPGTDKSFGGGSYGGQSIGFPDIGLLAKGGVVDRPMLALIGEARQREIVTPEPLMRELLAEAGAGATYTLNIYPRTADAADVAYGFRRLELLRTGR